MVFYNDLKSVGREIFIYSNQFPVDCGMDQGGRSERRTHRGNKYKHTRARDVTRDNLAKNSL